jgi:hypothetical protein
VQGIFIAVAISLMVFIWRAWRLYHLVPGKAVDAFVDRHPADWLDWDDAPAARARSA